MNYENLKGMKDSISADSEFVKTAIDQIVDKYSKELDEFVLLVRELLQLIKQASMQEYDDQSLELQIIKLPTILYFAGNGLEDIGAESEIAAYKRKELYNQIVEDLHDVSSDKRYTILDKKAAAEKATESEEIIERIYDRAYKKLKGKIEHAIKLLESLKKVADLRIAKMNKGKGWDKGGI